MASIYNQIKCLTILALEVGCLDELLSSHYCFVLPTTMLPPLLP